MKTQYERLLEIMTKLRSPQGCPWDLEQSHHSLIPYLIEETYEVIDAIEKENPHELCEELGDLLLQVVFHAQLAKEKGDFTMETIAQSIADKLVRRHPHVFGEGVARTAEEVSLNWDEIKKTEKKEKGSLLNSIPPSLPSLLQAFKLSKKAAKTGFDWNKPSDVMVKIKEEISELEEALAKNSSSQIQEEMGDLFFSLANLARHLKIDPEEALRSSNKKFRNRFACMESFLSEQNKSMETLSASDWENLWNLAKDKTNS